MEHHRAGRLQQAETLYQQQAGNADALHLLGLLYHESGRPDEALAALRQAIAITPANAAYHFSLDQVCRTLGRLPDAIDSYRSLLAIDAGNATVLLRLAHALRDSGQAQQALDTYLAVLARAPDNAEAYSNMGDTLKAMEQYGEAEACYLQALALQPRFPETLNNLGTLYQQRELWEQAARQFDAALVQRPDFSRAWYNLGVVRQQQQRFPDALACYSRAIELDRNFSEAYNNMGVCCRAMYQFDDAIACYRAALAIAPAFAEALNNLGGAFHDQTRYLPAIAQFEQALGVRPDYEEAYLNMGLSYMGLRRYGEALVCLRNAIHLNADYAEAYGLLAQAHGAMGEHEAALLWCRKILAIWPDSPLTHFSLGTAYNHLQRRADAAQAFRQAIALKPDFADAYNSLGDLYRLEGRFAEALQQYETALALRPSFPEVHNNLALVLKDLGHLDQARLHFERAIELNPSRAVFHHNLLLTMQYSPSISQQQLFDLHLRFGAQFEPELALKRLPHTNVRDPAKRLKIGYISPDFRHHAVSNFIEAVLAGHDKTQAEVFCYYSHNSVDSVTLRIEQAADHWVPCNAMSDQQLVQRIRDDGIDILVDLAGHTAHNRLLVFGYKAAPVQVSYLGYASTTGLNAIDYRLTDAWAEPPGEADRLSSERLWRLPETVACYTPRPGTPAVVARAPHHDNGVITFGCFNNYTKVSDGTARLWARILERVPGARLMLEIAGLDDPDFGDLVRQRFADLGVAPERLLLIPRASKNQFVLYNQIDIALDPFPYNGGTTSFDTLWMGVPFISLAGNSFTSRLGVSILHNGGLGELVAATQDDYVAIASALALDTARLDAMRDGLRERIAASALMDVPRFTRHLEQAYRDMWRLWCDGNDAPIVP